MNIEENSNLETEDQLTEDQIDLQLFYYNIIRVTDNPFLTDQEQEYFLTQIKYKRNCISYYAEQLHYFRPILLESLVNIYFNPEISQLIQILETSTNKRRLINVLRTLLCKHIRSQFPYGDNHTQLMNTFINNQNPEKANYIEF